MTMSALRREQLLNGQRANAQRIYTVIPITEPWPLKTIMTELGRIGHATAADIVQGALGSLVGAGLIREISGGFIRCPVREETPRPAPTPTPYPEKPMPASTQTLHLASPAQPEPDFVARLGQAADEMRKQSTAMAELADELDTLAVALGDRLAKADNDPEIARLRQLGALLKTMTAS